MPSAIYLGACFYDSARVCIFYIRMVIRLHKCSDMVHLVKHVCLVFSWYLDLCAHLVDLTFKVQQRTMLDPMIIGIACRLHSLHALQYQDCPYHDGKVVCRERTF